MTSKVYKTAQGKTVDLGAIMLQNEKVRAVGNMNVNARGDKLDSNNRVVDTKPRQIQRQNARITNVSTDPAQTSSIKAKKAKKASQEAADHAPLTMTQVDETPVALAVPPAQDTPNIVSTGGLAAAIARSRTSKQ